MSSRRRQRPAGPRGTAGTVAKMAIASLVWSAPLALAADSSGDKTTTSTTSTMTPCVATSTSGAFFDLRPDVAVMAEAADAKDASSGRFHLANLNKAPTEDYLARGWDYGANFTLNICDAVVQPVRDVVGVDRDMWKNVSAHYTHKGSVYSLGQQSATLTPRGRKLVLQYIGGSPCGGDDAVAHSARSGVHDGAKYKAYDDSNDKSTASLAPAADTAPGPTAADTTTTEAKTEKAGDKAAAPAGGPQAAAGTTMRKSATISFLCDRDPLSTQAAISFVGASPDQCAYFFEVRSSHACATAEPHKPGSIGPGSVFAIILLIAVIVYVAGGVFYQRTVSHARGWRQLPNYSLWAGMWSCVSDFWTIVTSSCTRFFPRRRGYRYISSSPTSGNRNREDENRLIDQLDEEWED